jgi:hypothetical protein
VLFGIIKTNEGNTCNRLADHSEPDRGVDRRFINTTKEEEGMKKHDSFFEGKCKAAPLTR